MINEPCDCRKLEYPGYYEADANSEKPSGDVNQKHQEIIKENRQEIADEEGDLYKFFEEDDLPFK